MALVDIQSDYHVALNGFGLILHGAPAAPAYQCNQAPLYNTRFGQGDRSYSDFSFWWFWAQTDFSGGYKQGQHWEDDATFMDANIISINERPGAIILGKSQATTAIQSADDMEWNHFANASGTGMVVGRNNTDQKMAAYKTDDGALIWEDTASGANEEIICTGQFGNGDVYIGCHTVGSGASFLKKGTGGAFADVGTFNTGDGIFQIVPYDTGDILYLFTFSAGIYAYSRSAGTFTLKKAYPHGQTALDSNISIKNGQTAWLIGTRIYFTMIEPSGSRTRLWAYDITTDAIVEIYAFGMGMALNRIIEFNNLLYAIGSGSLNTHLQVRRYNPSDGSIEKIIEIGRGSQTYQIISSPIRNAEGLSFIVSNGTIYQIWQMDSDEKFHPTILASGGTAADLLMMLPSGLATISDGESSTVAKLSSSSGRSTTGYFTTGVNDGGIGALDKLYYDVTFNFEALVTGQSITISYSTDLGVTFTSLGSASYAVDGAIKTKSLLFGSNIVSKNMVLKITLAGGGTNTPTFNDFAVRFVPLVNYTKVWNLRINVGDDVKRLSGQLVNKVARELKGMLETSWWTKAILDYQDLDYAATAINDGSGLTAAATTITVDSTADFPEQGRLLIENEQCFYTGKTPTTFTGVTRGARETLATTHADNVVVSNAYKVLVTDYGVVTPILDEGKNLEYVVSLQLREV